MFLSKEKAYIYQVINKIISATIILSNSQIILIKL